MMQQQRRDGIRLVPMEEGVRERLEDVVADYALQVLTELRERGIGDSTFRQCILRQALMLEEATMTAAARAV